MKLSIITVCFNNNGWTCKDYLQYLIKHLMIIKLLLLIVAQSTVRYEKIHWL